MTPLSPADRIRRTDDILEKYPDYWRDEQAQAELAALWGEAINDCGVFVDSPEEVLYDRDGHKAAINIGTSNGVYTFGCRYETTTEGYGAAPSVWGNMYLSHGEARTAAIEYLLKHLPESTYLHQNSQRQQLSRMRESVSNLLRQPSLF